MPAKPAVGSIIVLQGVRILRRADGLSYVEPPYYRHTDGDMVPAVVLPAELEDAIARAVLERAGGQHFTSKLTGFFEQRIRYPM